MKIKLIISALSLSLFFGNCFAQNKNTDNSNYKSGDLKNGYYRNPILAGDYADPSIMRDGSDYYMTHSSFDYMPGLTVLHSKDLVNWQPISYALKEYLGSVWAPDILKQNNKYYIYFTVSGAPKGGNYVVWANSPAGPWSNPISLKVGNIDPGHIVGEDGSQWLYFNGGNRVKLTDDGLAVDGTMEKVYDGWKYPSDWVCACFCLEAPKLRYINGYYYYVSAEGGTLGPPTAHMATLARSKSINGPWENSPYNPIVHTSNNDEHWWNQGHGSLINTPDNKWYIIYHAYENGYINLGRQTLMLPLEWTNDGWLRVPKNITADKPIKKPIKSGSEPSLHSRLAEFRVGYEWRFYKDYDQSRFSVKNNEITIKGKGDSPNNSSPLMFVGGNHAYQMEVEIELDPNTTAGLVVCYNEKFQVGMGASRTARFSYRRDSASRKGSHKETNKIWLRLKNDRHVVTGEYSFDGVDWLRDDWGQEISGYNNNTLGGFQSMLPGIFVSGKGQATFSNFKYKVL